MTREKAIDVWDTLTEAGYSVELWSRNMGDHIGPDGSNISYGVSLSEISIDKIDIKALAQIADELEVEVGYSALGHFHFADLDTRPEVVKNPRRHPVGR